jgi:hypothetical protein
LHPAVPFAGQHGARSYVSGPAVQVHRALARILGWSRSIKEPLAPGVQIAETIGLNPVSQNPKYEVAGQVRERSPAELVVPTNLKATNIEIAQARDLDF